MNRVVLNHTVGRVVAVSGAQTVILLRDPEPGQTGGGVQIGTLVKICGASSNVFGIVSSLSIPMPGQEVGMGTPDLNGQPLKLAEIDLLGEVIDAKNGGDGHFRRGVANMPTLNDAVLIANRADTGVVFAVPGAASISIGTLHQAPEVEACVTIDDMLGKHFAILGTTGAGKSCAVTLILKRLIAKAPNAHVLLLDPHGEYARAFGPQAEHLTSETLRLPYWLFNFEEIVEVVLGAEGKDLVAETLCLRDLILSAKLRLADDDKDNSWITVDTLVPYQMADVDRLLDVAIGRLENQTALGPLLRIRSRLTALRLDRRYGFMFPNSLFVQDDLARLLGRLFRIPVDGRPLAILDLAGVPSEVLNVVVSVLSRMAFDFALWGDQSAPLLLICEEAHRYAPQDSNAGFEPAKRALARIAKEGRKHGISLCVVSQRPSELASSLLSQCNTVFALRMSNQKDQSIIQAAIAESSAALLSSLPSLSNAEAIAVGEGVPVPMRLRFAELAPEERPQSATAPFSARWQGSDAVEDTLDRIVHCWRRQRRAESPQA